MQILVLGGDGYLDWPTALHLVPIATPDERIAIWNEISGTLASA